MQRSFRRDICYSKLLPTGKKGRSLLQRCNSCHLFIFLLSKLSTGQCKRLVQPHIFFILSRCGQSSQTYTFKLCSTVHCQKVLRTRFITDHFPYKQCNLWSGPVTVYSSEELHKHKMGTSSNTAVVLS